MIVVNISLTRSYYYSIAMQVNDGTAGVPLLSDTSSPGKNEFFDIKTDPLRGKAVKYVSKKRIYFLYPYYKNKTMRFGFMYY